jgi:hypothetical protein
MMAAGLITLTEDELDTLVSVAIRRAEVLDETGSPLADETWREVMVYEERLASITPADEIPGGIARVGAVTAALAAGERHEALRLASQYLDEELLPPERRAAIERAFKEDRERLAERFPALAKSGKLAELEEWRGSASKKLRVFPHAA